MISVIVPVYEEEKYLGYCLDSIIGQTYGDIEIIIVDDASKDNSCDIIREYAKKDKRIRCFFNKANLGAGPTRNVGIENAKGDYIAFIDCDDWVDKDYLEIMFREVQKEPKLDLVLVGSTVYDGNRYIKRIVKDKLYESGRDYAKDMLMGKVPTGGGNLSKLYSRRVTQNVRYKNFRCAQDGLFSRECLIHLNKVKTIDYCGYYYRTYQEIRHETRAAKTPNFYEKQIECAALTISAVENTLKHFKLDDNACITYVQTFKWTEFKILYERIFFDVYISMSFHRRINCMKQLLNNFYPPQMIDYVDIKKKKMLKRAFDKNSFLVFYVWMLFQPNSLKNIFFANIFPRNSHRGAFVRKVYTTIKKH
jgi:Glycosyltransferases involved in cell wall biogenesis